MNGAITVAVRRLDDHGGVARARYAYGIARHRFDDRREFATCSRRPLHPPER
jgi:hypothetical protein